MSWSHGPSAIAGVLSKRPIRVPNCEPVGCSSSSPPGSVSALHTHGLMIGSLLLRPRVQRVKHTDAFGPFYFLVGTAAPSKFSFLNLETNKAPCCPYPSENWIRPQQHPWGVVIGKVGWKRSPGATRHSESEFSASPCPPPFVLSVLTKHLPVTSLVSSSERQAGKEESGKALFLPGYEKGGFMPCIIHS